MTDGQMRMWLRECYRVATFSPDTSTQNGAMLVNSLHSPWLATRSFNGPPKGWVLQPEDLDRPRKYLLIEHSERRAIYRGAKDSGSTEGCVLVSAWAACSDCSRAIVEAGIKTLVRHTPPSDEAVNRWLESVSLGDEIMKAGGVTVINIEGIIEGAPPVLRDGKLFYPGGEG